MLPPPIGANEGMPSLVLRASYDVTHLAELPSRIELVVALSWVETASRRLIEFPE
jgi:hypothetical protein